VNGVIWGKAPNVGRCAECTERFAVGDRIARFTETGLTGYTGRRMHLRRNYCEPYGRLLEDSLSTTGTPEATQCPA
jgi:hypothetical protein